VLSDLPAPQDPRIVVDFRTADDAGVYRWDGGSALVQTVDFFTPIVDEPYVYGQIAAANALSDVYAMGGRPLTALAIAAFPVGDPDAEIVRAIFRGGFDKLREAGVALLGGHTVQDREVKFGYAITGAIDPARVLTNSGAKPGDVLLLTKPLGTGIIATALKFQRAPDASVAAAIASMTALNRAAAEVLAECAPGEIHACTDITGFGLIGHASEMAVASGCTIVFDSPTVPALEGALDLAQKNVPGGGKSNRDHFGAHVSSDRVDPDRLALMYDPQTSGGLLIAVRRDQTERLRAALAGRGATAWQIGEIEPQASALIRVR
jgi:selenide,water dikinase